MLVAPVRERGLKYITTATAISRKTSRSREGAWIEIQKFVTLPTLSDGRSREGAWIEI